jgi:hypothetical protein
MLLQKLETIPVRNLVSFIVYNIVPFLVSTSKTVKRKSKTSEVTVAKQRWRSTIILGIAMKRRLPSHTFARYLCLIFDVPRWRGAGDLFKASISEFVAMNDTPSFLNA